MGHKSLAAKRKKGEQQIDRQVIMEERDTGGLRELERNGVLAGSGRPVDEDYAGCRH
jgi:hypothetical protein